jgi:hypothetical protein
MSRNGWTGSVWRGGEPAQTVSPSTVCTVAIRTTSDHPDEWGQLASSHVESEWLRMSSRITPHRMGLTCLPSCPAAQDSTFHERGASFDFVWMTNHLPMKWKKTSGNCAVGLVTPTA